LLVELRQLGGALAESPDGAGAMGSIDAAYTANSIGSPMDPAMLPGIEAHLAKVSEAMEPWATGKQYMNFAEIPDTPAEQIFDDATSARLAEVKRTWDPDGIIRGKYEI